MSISQYWCRVGLSAVLLGFSSSLLAQAMTVYKSESCGCCNDWIDHVREAGIEVEAVDLIHLNRKKQELGMPPQLASCHTAVIEGYLIEGHVPVSDIQRLLQERPAITGLAVPGMPHGSPGMETGRLDSYDVIGFDLKTERLEVWSSYNQ
ncbi:DUF411 domain-containing protein [Marinospirillum alkaliphilum]|uniref:Uncharacterized conserved protein n=1 Tax=Marinospirillum alkaliphilum DSM 21637 TaxID=1122209 RepID=A0A1K1V3C4_9GAMM|nr:DUF411 domain-containing protein [Marinospirillum alkaliphilum]SFX19276.1 Uncharacterized conserved protein [Marinospirillum alkaliphilum DSM 21637]